MVRHLKNSRTAEGKLEIQAGVRATVETIVADILSYGDKVIGTNHTLPTMKAARYTGGLMQAI